MATTVLGLVLSLIGTVGLAGMYLLIRLGAEDGKANNAVFIVMGTNLLILTPVALVLYYPTYGLTTGAIFWFVLAGLTGTLIGRTLTYTSVSRIGASRTSPVVSAQILVATVAGVIVLGETVTLVQMVGIILLLLGVVLISLETSRDEIVTVSRRELAIGLFLPIGAATAYGIEPIFANFGFAEGTPALVGLIVRIVAGTVAFSGFLWIRNQFPSRETLKTMSSRWFLLAGVSNTVFVAGFYVALSLAPVHVVVPIIQSYPILVVILSGVVMPDRLETITWKLVASTVIVVVGIVILAGSA